MDFAALAMDVSYSYEAGPGAWIGGLIGYIIGGLLLVPVFGKAGEPRWAGFVPFYGSYVHTRVAGFNPWMFLLYLIPLVNIVFAIVVALRIGKAFGRSGVFSFFLLFLLAPIGYLIIGLGSSTYDRSRVAA